MKKINVFHFSINITPEYSKEAEILDTHQFFDPTSCYPHRCKKINALKFGRIPLDNKYFDWQYHDLEK